MNDIKEDVAPQTAPETPQEEKFDKLSTRDALERVMKERAEAKADAPSVQEEPTKAEVKEAVEADLEPPSEFSAAGKQAWKEKNIAGIQREFRRIHDARTQEITRAQRAERETLEKARPWMSLGEKAAPYIAARGKQGVPPETAMMEALALVDSFKSSDPATVKAELKKIGIDLDKASGAPAVALPPEVTQRLDTLQRTTEDLIKERETRRFQEVAQSFESIFKTLGSQKTRTGEPVLPDLHDNSEAGAQFAREIGSLTADERFRAGVMRRIPDADESKIVLEAYKFLGGRVSGPPVGVSTSNQQHVEKSRRAAASTPARPVNRGDSSNLIGKLGQRAAIERAIAESRER